MRSGDTVYSISRQFQVSVTQLKSWNGLNQRHQIRAGQRLVMYVDPNGSSEGSRAAWGTMGFLNGKRALIVGLATDRSIAWGIAQAMHREGAELAFSHIERMADRVVPLAKQLGIRHHLRHGRRRR